MIKFNWKNIDSNNVPILSAKDMDWLSEMLIRDYNPDLLKEPHPIDFEGFLEFYMNVNLQYQDLRSEKPEESILGLTVFDDDYVIIYDRDYNKLKKIEVHEGTIVLNQQLLSSESQGRLRFTALHEGTHWWCHGGYFRQDILHNSSAIASRSTYEENFAFRKCTTPYDWLEYQADYMASALAMPKTTFIK